VVSPRSQPVEVEVRALSRLVIEPALLLPDEPVSNLDARLRVQMRAELVKLQRRLGITTVYVTHDQDDALLLSQRIAVMDRGRLVQLGPQDVFEQPADAFVANLSGGPRDQGPDGAGPRWVLAVTKESRWGAN